MRRMTEEEAKQFDMNSQVKYVVNKYQDVISKIDIFEKVLDNLLKKQEVSESIFKDHDKALSLVSSDLSIINSNISVLKKSSLSSLDLINHSLNELGKKSEDNRESVNEIMTCHHRDVDKLMNKYSDLGVSYCQSVALSADVKSELTELKEEVRLNFQHDNESLIGMLDDLENVKKTVVLLAGDLSSSSMLIKSAVLKVDAVGSDLQTHKASLKPSLDSLKELLMTYVNEKVSSIPQSIIPPPVDVSVQIKAVVEPATLDAKNANLRSVNNEAKIFLLEKKVEQLQLLLNKLQLQG